MTIRESLFFSYAGRSSIDYGILNVNMSSGMLEEPLAASREILEESVRGRDRPYFQGIRKSPLKFNVSFAFEDSWNTAKMNEVARWLTEHTYYQPLFFSNEIGRDPERIYYALVVDEPNLVHNGLRQGYITLTFRCDSPYTYSPQLTSREYKWDQKPLDVPISDFTTGNSAAMTTDGNGYLILNPVRPKLADIPPNTKLAEL
ncbi:phage tail domain-containing protein [Paenibacillus tuaregi]|uniref:phage tail domain-containing protein n=1 Tax=Paenibacillus tuaregi TaxID=1816681 RepID=UPI0008398F90|nr:phage tail domain-containing protein [Paenibacillus tuaregi]